MGYKLVTAPSSVVISLEEAKQHLRVDHSDEDDLIEAYTEAATGAVEQESGRALVDQTWDLYLDAMPDSADDPIEIAKPPLLEILGVFYRDSAGDEQEFAAASYNIDDTSIPARIVAVSAWPTAKEMINAVRVRFRAGYVDTSSSPAVGEVVGALRQAILMTLSHLYHNRESVVIGVSAVELPRGAMWLIEKHRAHRGFA